MGSFTSSITGLTSGTSYYVRAYATNSVGTAYGNPVTANSLAISPTLSTTNLSAVTATTATGGGIIASDGGAPITGRGVCWSTSPNPTIVDSKTIDGTGTGSFTSSITGLTPGTTYYVRAYATNSVGTVYGNQVTMTTLSGLATVTTPAGSVLTSTSAQCGGYISAQGDAPVTSRGVCWSTTENPTIEDSRSTDGSGAGTFVSTLTGLSLDRTYYIRAYATNSYGTSYGNQVSVSTSPYDDGDYILLREATIGNGVDLVFMGDGYTAAEIASRKYENQILEAVNNFFGVEPYKSYSEYFNVYLVFAVSEESGIGNKEHTVNNLFGTRFETFDRSIQTK